MNRIDGVRLKIERAKEHVRNLGDAITRFGESEPYMIFTKENTAIEHTTLYVGRINTVPEGISLILGDSIHNLRSALDHLAWQLVEAGGGVPDSNTMFPICETAKQYAAALQRKRIRGVHPDAEKLIASIQPYATGDQTLWHLNTLDIGDKHRLIVAVTLVYKGWQVNTLGRGNILEFPQGQPYSLLEGDEIVNIPTSTYERESHGNFTLSVDIAFGESEIVAREPVFETVNKMADFVGDTVSAFEPFLI